MFDSGHNGDGTRRILVITGDERRAALIEFVLLSGAWSVRRATAATAAALVTEWRPDVVLVDLELEDALGPFERIGRGPPIIVLARRRGGLAMLAAFESGADDVVSFPLQSDELIARISGVLRRRYGAPPMIASRVWFGGLELDLFERTLRTQERVVHLTLLQQSILYMLMSNSGETLTRDDILTNVWGLQFSPDSNVVDRHIADLRRKLRDVSTSQLIRTVPGVGYRFRLPPAAE